MGGVKVEDYAPKLTLDDAVTEDVNARLGVATAKEIDDILVAHRDKDFLRLLKLRAVPIDSLGKVEWGGHEAVKTNEIAMRCKLLSLRLDKSRNAHAKAPAAQRAVKNVLDLMSHKDTRKGVLDARRAKESGRTPRRGKASRRWTRVVHRRALRLRRGGDAAGGGELRLEGHAQRNADVRRDDSFRHERRKRARRVRGARRGVEEVVRAQGGRVEHSGQAREQNEEATIYVTPPKISSEKYKRARASCYKYAKPLIRTIQCDITVRDRSIVEPTSRAIDIFHAQLVPHVFAQRHHAPRQPPRLQRPLHWHQRIGPAR